MFRNLESKNYLLRIKYNRLGGTWSTISDQKFESIPDVISYYQTHDIPTPPTKVRYTVRLREPVERNVGESIEEAKEMLLNDSLKVGETEDELNTLKLSLTQCREKIPPGQKKVEALIKSAESIKLNQKKLEDARANRSLSSDGITKLDGMFSSLSVKLEEANNELAVEEKTMEQLKNVKQKLELDFQQRNMRFSQMFQKQTKRRIELELSNQAIAFEDNLTKQQQFNNENKHFWFFHRCSRENAESLFKDCYEKQPDALEKGTFLVRPSKKGGFAISIWMKNEVKHVQLVYEDGKYGISIPYVIYASKEDVVVHYTITPLTIHNQELDSPLTSPLGHVRQRLGLPVYTG